MGNLAISFWVGRRIYSMEQKEPLPWFCIHVIPFEDCPSRVWQNRLDDPCSSWQWKWTQTDRHTHTHTHTHTQTSTNTHTHNHFSHLFHICCCYSYNEFMSVINRSWQGIQKPHHIACCLYHGWIYHPLATGSVDCIPLYMLWQVHSPWLEGEVVTAPV